MLPQKSTILLVAVMTMATLLSLGSLSSLIPLDVYASHSYEAGVQGDAIPDNTHIDLSQLILPSAGVFPLYDSSPNFVSGHFLYRAPCDPVTKVPLVAVIAGHIDESANLTHVDFVPLYYVGHASPLPGICVYHAHIPDPLEGGSPRVTDIDLVNYSNRPVIFNQGDAVDVNIQRTLGSIGNYYAGNVLLPLQLAGGQNKVLDLNEHATAATALVDDNINVQQYLSSLSQFNNVDNDVSFPFELANENNQIFNLKEQHDSSDNDEEDEVDEEEEEDRDDDNDDDEDE
jgi:hypothetical protein